MQRCKRWCRKQRASPEAQQLRPSCRLINESFGNESTARDLSALIDNLVVAKNNYTNQFRRLYGKSLLKKHDMASNKAELRIVVKSFFVKRKTFFVASKILHERWLLRIKSRFWLIKQKVHHSGDICNVTKQWKLRNMHCCWRELHCYCLTTLTKLNSSLDIPWKKTSLSNSNILLRIPVHLTIPQHNRRIFQKFTFLLNPLTKFVHSVRRESQKKFLDVGTI